MRQFLHGYGGRVRRWMLVWLVCLIPFTVPGLPSARLAWDANTETNIAGYKLYSGGVSRVYTNITVVGNNTSTTVSNLVEGRNYYFALTAYDNLGLESDFSLEVVLDNVRPLLAITSPSANLRITNNSVTVLGTASDNAAVSEVLYRVGSNPFQPAVGTTSWSATVPLEPGVNVFQAKSIDSTGSESLVATRYITNVVGAVLTVLTTGSGSVSPNYNGQWLEIGRSYTITAQPAAGFRFANWSGSLPSASAQLTFVMQSNLTLVANFVDGTLPGLVVTSPANNLVVTNSTLLLQGTASDNAGLAQVLYQLNGGPFLSAVGTVAWSAAVTLLPGTNVLNFKSIDLTGNESPVVSRVVTYILRAPVSITTGGSGTVSPNLNGQWLDIGRAYTVTAVPAAGHAFTNWSGSLSATTPQLTFVMQSNLNLVANFFDNSPPSLAITSPSANLRITNDSITVSGTASDNVAVSQVLWRAGAGPFQSASGTTAWSATMPLAPGVNVFQAKSIDATGNESALATRYITNVVGAVFTVSTTGSGSVSPNYNGQWLEIGRSYTITAIPAAGFAFRDWSGSLSATTPQVTFVMQSNLALVANFYDNANPSLAITAPAGNLRITNDSIIIHGTASDNAGVAQVLWRQENNPFQLAEGTTSWSATMPLAPGLNVFQARSVDTSGNESALVTRYITNVVGAVLTVSTNGKGSISPNYAGQWLEIGRTYTVTAVPAAGFAFSDWSGSVSATTPQITFVMQQGLTLVASFRDAANPVVAVTSPVANSTVTTNTVLLQGTASDNGGVAEVLYSLNGGPFERANGTTSWSAELSLYNKTNFARIKCIDTTGNESTIVSHMVIYSHRSAMRLARRGKGTVTPDLNNQMLEVGNGYTITATPQAGYAFSGWSGSLSSTNPRLSFLMETNLDLTATFTDSAKPTVTVVSPAANLRLTNGAVIFTGRATDNEGVAQVLCSLNGGPFEVVSGTSNWTASINLPAGPNTVRFKSVDLGGLESAVVVHPVTSVTMAPISIAVNGKGTVTPIHGQFLEIGKVYSAVARPAAGYVLTNWSGSIFTNRASFNFAMESNLTLVANFVDVTKPALTITFPTANARLTNNIITMHGRVTDNGGVAQVLYQHNDAPVEIASGTTNWAAPLTLRAGFNSLRVWAVDTTGNSSLVVSQAVTYVVMFPIAMNMIGKGTLTPVNGQWLEVGKTYTASARPAVGFGLTNWSGSVATNRASFSFIMQSNFTLTANFVDVMKPTVSILGPANNLRTTNGSALFHGRASDNLAVAQVLYGLNSGPWQVASGTTNWAAPLELAAGPNKLRVKAIDVTGWESPTLTQTVTHVVMWPIVLNTSGAGTITPNLNGQRLEIGKSYTVTAVPAAGHLLSNWVGSAYAETPALTFIMGTNFTLTAQFAPNPFVPTKGDYNGLFYESTGVLHDRSGFLKVTLTDRGSFSGSMICAGQTLPFSGTFNLNGRARPSVNRPGKTPLSLDLQLDLANGTRQITGTVSDGVWVADYTGDQSRWNTTNNPFKGKYGIVLPGTPSNPGLPPGHSYGSVVVDPTGNLLFSGRSADGQVLSQSVPISRNGEWPLYLNLYSGRGSMLSWLTLTNQNGEPLHGTLSWIKSPQVTPYYPAGFDQELDVASSTFVPPAGTNRVADFKLIRLTATQGNLPHPLAYYVELTWANTIWNTNMGNFTMNIDNNTGLISGSFKIPGTSIMRPYYGVLLQNRNAGYGYFLGTDQGGEVRIEPATANPNP